MRLCTPVLLILLLGSVSPLAAQASPLRFSLDPRLSPPSREVPAVPSPPTETAPPFLRVASGTLIGGLLGGLTLGLAGYAIGSADSDQGFISTRDAFGAYGALFGYPLGAALGAQYGASRSGVRPPLSGIMAASLASAVVGGLIWNRVGEALEPSDPSRSDYTSWQMGFVTGVSVHMLATTWTAWRAAARIRGDTAADSRQTAR